MNSRKLILLTLLILALGAGGYLLLQLQKAFAEYSHWQTRRSGVGEGIGRSSPEAKNLREFWNACEETQTVQDAIARKELGLW